MSNYKLPEGKSLIMLSDGDYADYSVRGMYIADDSINHAALKKLRCDYAEEMGLPRREVEFHDDLSDYRMRVLHIAKVAREHYKLNPCDFTGEAKTSADIYSKQLEIYNQSGKAIKFNFVQWLVDNNVIVPIEYDEISLD